MATNPSIIVDAFSKHPYDPETSTEVIDVDMTDETFIALAKMAHARDITLNHLMNAIIVEHLDKLIPPTTEPVE